MPPNESEKQKLRYVFFGAGVVTVCVVLLLLTAIGCEPATAECTMNAAGLPETAIVCATNALLFESSRAANASPMNTLCAIAWFGVAVEVPPVIV